MDPDGSPLERFGFILRQNRKERGFSLDRLAKQVHVSADLIQKVETGKRRPSRQLAESCDRELSAAGEIVRSWTALNEQLDEVHKAPELDNGIGFPQWPGGDDETIRRDLLKLGLISSATAPAIIQRVLRQSASEVAEFTRRAEASAVGLGMLDHLNTVVADLSEAYSRESPAELFCVAGAYRRRIEKLIRGPHTLHEARELYVCVAWLSETLAWTAHDLGDPIAADAYCADAFEHAAQAGHDELCAWAMDARASIAMYHGKPAKALTAAAAGIARAPADHPLAVRLHAQAARAHAKLGHGDEFHSSMTSAQRMYDRLPARGPYRHGVSTAQLAAYAITSYAATSFSWLGEFTEARSSAEAALKEYSRATPEDRSPTREAIAQIDLAIAVNGLGEPYEAAQLGLKALSSERMVNSIILRAGELGRELREPGIRQEFAEQLHLLQQPQDTR